MQYPVKTCLGRFQTRLNRIVDITSSCEVTELIQGENVTRRVWNGQIMKADGHTVDTAGQWEDNGAYRNQRGVACPMDLCIMMQSKELQSKEPPAAPPPAPPRIEGSFEPPPPQTLACPFCQAQLRRYHNYNDEVPVIRKHGS
jgi:hypothetical protein